MSSIPASNKPIKIAYFVGVADAGNASFTGVDDIVNIRIAGVVDTGDALVKHLPVCKCGAQVCIQYSKESFNYNKTA